MGALARFCCDSWPPKFRTRGLTARLATLLLYSVLVRRNVADLDAHHRQAHSVQRVSVPFIHRHGLKPYCAMKLSSPSMRASAVDAPHPASSYQISTSSPASRPPGLGAVASRFSSDG